MTVIVENMARNIIEPHLEGKFTTLLGVKVEEMSRGIEEVLREQLEALNESMRKIEIKENNLRGKKIYDYSREIDTVKKEVKNISSSIKEREVNKYACNQLVVR